MEVLDPVYTTRAEAAPVVNRALRNFRTAKRTTLQVMADLRTLQDREAHILYGERNFATWAEDTFDGLQASNVKQLTRAGGVALELQRRKLIDISKGAPIGSTGLRELSVVANTYGDDKMAEVYATALGMVEGRDISDRTVQAAMQLLMPPAATDLDIPEAAIAENEDEDELTAAADDEADVSEATAERIDRIRDLTWDLPETADELAGEVASLQRELNGETLDDDGKWLASGR
jgi:hypothetical protein